MQWDDRWLAKNGKPFMALVEDKTGRQIEQMVVRSEGGKPLTFHEVRFAPGSGATAKTQLIIDGSK